MAANVAAICISGRTEQWKVPTIPFYCYTKGWRPIVHHDNKDRARLEYITERYNLAIREGLSLYPKTTHILIVDSYYVNFASEIQELVRSYEDGSDASSVMGASIWYRDRSHIRSCIRYYDTASAIEMRERKWYKTKDLPIGLIRVSGVGACWILPRETWEESGGFVIPDVDPVAGSSRSLSIGKRLNTVLNCGVKLWRTHADNVDIPTYSPIKRIQVSFGEARRKIWS
jgi:hypothetical protein